MEDLINTLASLSTKDLENMIVFYKTMPDGLMKDTFRISLLNIIDYINVIKGV